VVLRQAQGQHYFNFDRGFSKYYFLWLTFGSSDIRSSGSEQKPVARSCEHGIETFGFTKGGELLDQLSDY
jgi:hypothetical protein